MKEILFNFNEFKERIDSAKPLHHCAMRKPIDKHGIFQRIVFRVYGIDKNNGHILIFETQKRTSIVELEQHPREYQKLVEQFAKPLGSTEGAWVP